MDDSAIKSDEIIDEEQIVANRNDFTCLYQLLLHY